MADVSEIGPEIYRISVYMPELDMQFNHFLLKDDEPLLFHAGYNAMIDAVREGVATVLDPATIRWVGYSHFESDECGSLNKWLECAPRAEPVCCDVSAMVNLNDFSLRPAKSLADGETFSTGKRTYRLVRTPHLPHGWDASLLFEESSRTLLCSDLFHHMGNVEALTESDVAGRSREALTGFQQGPLADYAPFTPYTGKIFEKLAALKPETLAIQHGSSFRGDGESALRDLSVVFKEILGGQ